MSVIVESPTSEQGITYDRAYLDSMPTILVLQMLNLNVEDAQQALADLDVNKYPASLVLTRLAAHLVMVGRVNLR